MKDWLIRRGHWLLLILAIASLVVICLPTVTLRVTVGQDSVSGDYGLNVLLTMWRGAQGTLVTADQTLLAAEGLMGTLPEGDTALSAQVLLPLTAALVCGVVQSVLTVLMLIAAARDRIHMSFPRLATSSAVLTLLSLLGWQLAVSALSNALAAADRLSLFGFDTVSVWMRPTPLFYVLLALTLLLLLGSWRLRSWRQAAPPPPLSPIL